MDEDNTDLRIPGPGADMNPVRFLVAMDSFKGSLTSLEAGNAVKRGILRACPDAAVDVFPLADGGEGTLESIAPFIGGETVELTVTGPAGTPVDSSYIFDPSCGRAYIEMARASGLTLIPEDARDPLTATSFGTGELMADAVRKGSREIFVFIGGSATNDGGAGMLQAMGASLKDSKGNDIARGAIGLRDLVTVDTSDLTGKGVSVTVACDVTNPLCGPDGASFVYGPQKGASPATCAEMDSYLRHFASVAGFSSDEEGTGAAGGMSFALRNFFGAALVSGAEMVLAITGAESEIRDCNIVITGEGRMDSQTVNGKAPYKVLELGLKYGKPVLGICGITGAGVDKCMEAGFKKIVPLIRPVMEREEAIRSVEDTAESLIKCQVR